MQISEMKFLIRKILLFFSFFFLFTVIINTVFLLIIALTDWDFVKRRESLKFNEPSFKVLVLGTSLAEYGIDTEFLSANDIESYNLSFVGSSIRTNYIQLEEYLSRYQVKPDYVLLGMNSFLERFDNEGIQPVVEFTMKGHRYGIKDLPISKFNWAGMELIKKLFRSKYRQTYVSFGQKKCTYYLPDKSGFIENFLDLQKYKSAYWIGKISQLCYSNGISLILIEMPGVNETQNISPVGPYEIEYNMGGMATLFNFNNRDFCDFINDDADWAGLSHFNMYGAQKFTSRLLDTVFVKQDFAAAVQ
jgi:hypothetical protein